MNIKQIKEIKDCINTLTTEVGYSQNGLFELLEDARAVCPKLESEFTWIKGKDLKDQPFGVRRAWAALRQSEVEEA